MKAINETKIARLFLVNLLYSFPNNHDNSLRTPSHRLRQHAAISRMRTREGYALTYPQLQDGRVDFSDLADGLRFLKPNLNGALDVLLDYKLLQREADKADRRKRWLSITPTGREFVLKLCGIGT
jgi:DNA-binding MarR family transcriptional regulator